LFSQEAAALPLKKRALRGRCLVAVDIENAVGGAIMDVSQAVHARRAITKAARLRGDEQVVIGTSHTGMLNAGLGWAGSRLVVRSGENGADFALIGVLTEEDVVSRFDRVILVSGDGIFTETVVALSAAGVRVTIVARRQACSKRLRMAAHRTTFIDPAAAGVGGAA
jgi:hypothetical protein